MPDIARSIVREPDEETPAQFARRVRLLGVIYLVMCASSVAGIVLLLQWAKLFVTLAQRSNVETLVLLFLLAYFFYFILLSWSGAIAALRIGFYLLVARIAGVSEAERRKIKAIGKPEPGDRPTIALNLLLERAGRPGEAFELEVADEYGSLGKIRIDGAKVSHEPTYRGGSTSLLIFFVHQTNRLLEVAEREIEIVEWGSINRDALEKYVGLTQFARNLERQLQMDEAWPKLRLTDEQCRELERRLSQVCRPIRSEALLPDWEYSGEHKLPLIPEPLGLFSLKRSEQRVDPVSSMGFGAGIVVVSLVALVLLVLAPPWVPGT